MKKLLTRVVLALAAVAGVATEGHAQYAHPLFLTTVRDPVAPENPTTARSLALGGVPATSGTAEDARACPANLLRSTGTDVVVSGGLFLFGRAEPAATPRFWGALDTGLIEPAALQDTGSSSANPVGFAAIATRRSRWAAAMFFDATNRVVHRFDTASAVVASQFFGFISVPGAGASSSTTAVGSATFSESLTRVGASLAVAPIKDRIMIGVAVSGVRLQYGATASLAESRTGGSVTTQLSEEESIHFDDWAPSWGLSAAVNVTRALSLIARWTEEPRFNSTRLAALSGSSSNFSVAEPAQIQLPATVGVSASVAFRKTLIVVDGARLAYGAFFQSVPIALPAKCPYNASEFSCGGWGWAENNQPISGATPPRQIDGKLFGTRDAFAIRGGVEQNVSVGHGLLSVRGGLAFEQGHSFAEAVQSYMTAIPPGAEEYPLREDMTTWSAGIGYTWARMELGAAVASNGETTRVLADLRVRLP